MITGNASPPKVSNQHFACQEFCRVTLVQAFTGTQELQLLQSRTHLQPAWCTGHGVQFIVGQSCKQADRSKSCMNTTNVEASSVRNRILAFCLLSTREPGQLIRELCERSDVAELAEWQAGWQPQAISLTQRQSSASASCDDLATACKEAQVPRAAPTPVISLSASRPSGAGEGRCKKAVPTCNLHALRSPFA